MQVSTIHENVKLAVLSSVINNSQRDVFQLETSGENKKREKGCEENANVVIGLARWGFKSHPLHQYKQKVRGCKRVMLTGFFGSFAVATFFF